VWPSWSSPCARRSAAPTNLRRHHWRALKGRTPGYNAKLARHLPALRERSSPVSPPLVGAARPCWCSLVPRSARLAGWLVSRVPRPAPARPSVPGVPRSPCPPLGSLVALLPLSQGKRVDLGGHNKEPHPPISRAQPLISLLLGGDLFRNGWEGAIRIRVHDQILVDDSGEPVAIVFKAFGRGPQRLGSRNHKVTKKGVGGGTGPAGER